MRHFINRVVVPQIALEDDLPNLGTLEDMEPEDRVIEQSVADGENRAGELDVGLEAVGALEGYASILRETGRTTGLNESAARSLQLALYYQYARLQMQIPSQFALESCGGSVSYQKASEIALEGLGETLKAVWDAIIKALNSAWKWLKDHFKLLFNKAQKTHTAAQETAEAVKLLTHKESKRQAVENTALYHALEINGKIDHTLVTALKIMAGDVYLDSETYNQPIGRMLAEDFANGAKNHVNGMKDRFGFGQTPVPAHYSTVTNPEKDGFSNIPDDIVIYRSPVYPGEMVKYIHGARRKLLGDEALAVTHVINKVVMKRQVAINHTETKLLPVLKQEEAELLVELVLTLSSDVINAQKDMEEYAAEFKKILSEADRAAKEAVKNQDKALTEDARKIFKMLQTGLAGSPVFMEYVLRVCQAVLRYIDVSIKQYK